MICLHKSIGPDQISHGNRSDHDLCWFGGEKYVYIMDRCLHSEDLIRPMPFVNIMLREETFFLYHDGC